MARIHDGHLQRYRDDGFVVVDGFMTEDELRAAAADLARLFPSWSELTAEPDRWPDLHKTGDAVAELPFPGTALNHMSTHPELIRFAERVLAEERVFLTQSICWAKYAGRSDFEQSLHLDWHDNSLAMPRGDGAYGQLHMILYYTDVEPGLAPTALVPRAGAQDRALTPWARTKLVDPALYEREQLVHAKAGTLVCFSGRTFHRCTGFSAATGHRISHHLAWRGAGHEWMSWRGWAQYADQLHMRRWFERTSAEQRSVLGFPPPRHPYWNEESLALVQARYPRMDLTPYRTPKPGSHSG
ncbi:phytanoyl-CoA dioxygenase family protein [Dactylosporangium sp. CA-139066]|uniref:phytanoyl-CoA dioxygenase family protein n=1 Tax=Dactylosporangium sp. CA-139066 TaxID=3239930 RepID=UPI003D8F4796